LLSQARSERFLRVIRHGLALAAGAVVSCSLVVDTDSLAEGCPTGTKFCGGSCVEPTPEVGCARAGCLACFLNHATPLCSATGECVIGACHSGWDNCDGNSSNGCEVDKRQNVNHCGMCNNRCLVPNAVPDCANGVCAVLSCNPGWGDCTGAPGCETDLSRNQTCGSCDTACPSGQSCVGSPGNQHCE
jgi:hypothetical protein